jgi:hypothetical protein
MPGSEAIRALGRRSNQSLAGIPSSERPSGNDDDIRESEPHGRVGAAAVFGGHEAGTRHHVRCRREAAGVAEFGGAAEQHPTLRLSFLKTQGSFPDDSFKPSLVWTEVVKPSFFA